MKAHLPKTVRTPIFRDTAFHLPDSQSIKQAFDEEKEYPREPNLYIYSRYRNPTVANTETKIMALEGSKWSILSQSGLSAIDIALSVFQESECHRPWLFLSEIYGGTNQYIDEVLIRRRGINVHRFYPNGSSYDLNQLNAVFNDIRPKVVFFEALSNPMLIALDAQTLIQMAREYGAYVIVDNTFGTPYLWQPLANGAHMVIHSVTKYLAGHGTISAGVVSGNDRELEKKVLEYRKLVGHMLSPDDAARLSEQLETFELRVHKQFENAAILAQFLSGHPMIEQVLHPSLKEHPTHAFASQLFANKGYGAILTFDISGETLEIKRNRCNRLIDWLQHEIPLLPTLGDVRTSLMPIEPVWGEKFPYPGMVRLSVGIEDVNMLKTVFSDVLDRL